MFLETIQSSSVLYAQILFVIHDSEPMHLQFLYYSSYTIIATYSTHSVLYLSMPMSLNNGITNNFKHLYIDIWRIDWIFDFPRRTEQRKFFNHINNKRPYIFCMLLRTEFVLIKLNHYIEWSLTVDVYSIFMCL
jgi:hypothetical protein